LEDRINVGESSCNSGDGTDQRVRSLVFMMMVMMMMILALRKQPNKFIIIIIIIINVIIFTEVKIRR
jgi:hypothetical protein